MLNASGLGDGDAAALLGWVKWARTWESPAGARHAELGARVNGQSPQQCPGARPVPRWDRLVCGTKDNCRLTPWIFTWGKWVWGIMRISRSFPERIMELKCIAKWAQALFGDVN